MRFFYKLALSALNRHNNIVQVNLKSLDELVVFRVVAKLFDSRGAHFSKCPLPNVIRFNGDIDNSVSLLLGHEVGFSIGVAVVHVLMVEHVVHIEIPRTVIIITSNIKHQIAKLSKSMMIVVVNAKYCKSSLWCHIIKSWLTCSINAVHPFLHSEKGFRNANLAQLAFI